MQGELVCSGASVSSFHLRTDDIVAEQKKLPHSNVLHIEKKLCNLLADQAMAQFLNRGKRVQVAKTKCDLSSVCILATLSNLFEEQRTQPQ